MLARARRLDFVVTASEVEALILENRLIKQHRPRYNINLRDDKTYPYVRLTTGETWPRAVLTRRVRDDGHGYFGPFLGHGMAGGVMDLIRTRTQVRTCTGIKSTARCRAPACTTTWAPASARAWPASPPPRRTPRRSSEVACCWTAGTGSCGRGSRSRCGRRPSGYEYERRRPLPRPAARPRRARRGQDVELAGPRLGRRGRRGRATAPTPRSCVLVYRDGKLVDKREFHWEGLEGPRRRGAARRRSSPSTTRPTRRCPRASRCRPAGGRGRRAAARVPAQTARRRGAGRRAAARRARAACSRWPQDNARAGFRAALPGHSARGPASWSGGWARRSGSAGAVRRIECFDISHTGGEATRRVAGGLGGRCADAKAGVPLVQRARR